MFAAPPPPYPQDQIHHLREAGIRAASFTANADWNETRALMGDIMAAGSDVRCLFVTPEKVGSQLESRHWFGHCIKASHACTA
jgi:superfamily II DNA helicase RecQ